MVQTTLSWGPITSNSNYSHSNLSKSKSKSIAPNINKAYSAAPTKNDSTLQESSETSSNSSLFTPAHNSRFHNKDLRAICHETKKRLPVILDQLPDLHISASSFHHLSSSELGPLRPSNCPGFSLPSSDRENGRKGTRIHVYDQDSFDAALDLQPEAIVSSILASLPSQSSSVVDTDTQMSNTIISSPPTSRKPVAVLNLASDRHPGGGWENGTLAQEEALCYRSSLYLSLHRSYYPLPLLSMLYSPTVILIRNALSRGHSLLHPATAAEHLPVTSVITVAALRKPEIDEDGTYAQHWDRTTMKRKIRGTLRIAVLKGHTRIVLGALGCGAFGNPPGEVAQCFFDVFKEEEFRGGWWEDVVFAILDNAGSKDGGKDGVGNFGVFWRALDGVVV